MNTACRCCGQPLPEDLPLKWDAQSRTLLANGKSATLTPCQGVIVDAIWRHRRMGGITTRADLIAAAYAEDPNGGPDQMSTVSAHLCHIRRKIEPIGWTITKNLGHSRESYRLVPT